VVSFFNQEGTDPACRLFMHFVFSTGAMASVEALLAVPLKLKFVSKPSPRPMRLGGIRPGMYHMESSHAPNYMPRLANCGSSSCMTHRLTVLPSLMIHIAGAINRSKLCSQDKSRELGALAPLLIEEAQTGTRSSRHRMHTWQALTRLIGNSVSRAGTKAESPTSVGTVP